MCTGIAYTVQRLATDWTVRGSNAGEGPGAHPASYTMCTWSLPAVNCPRRGAEYPFHLAPRLKKEYSYTYTPPLGLSGLFKDKIYPYLHNISECISSNNVAISD